MQLFRSQISSDAANEVYRDDNAVAGGGLVDVQDLFADFPELHEQALEAEAVCKQTQPQQMAVHPVDLGPDNPQKFGPGRYFYPHHLFDALAVAHGVDHRTDAADPFNHLDHLMNIAQVQPAFRVPYGYIPEPERPP